MRIRTKRIYEDVSRMDDYRVLVDRLWPRGVKKEEAELDEWLKSIAPSDELRKWFGHDPGKWDEFRRRYADELAEHDDELRELVERSPKKTVTLLYGAKDAEHNNAVVVKEHIEKEIL